MRTWALFDPATSQVMQFTTTAAGSPQGMCEAMGLQALEVPAGSMMQSMGRVCYIAAGLLCIAPPRPSATCTFDFQSRQWAPDAALADREARARRSELLTACDWSQLPDVALATQLLWRTYRQALRDMTGQAGYPFTIAWPTPPGA